MDFAWQQRLAEPPDGTGDRKMGSVVQLTSGEAWGAGAPFKYSLVPRMAPGSPRYGWLK